jgi:hypothetical protein
MVCWLTISRLRDLSRAQWCEDTKTIILESDHYTTGTSRLVLFFLLPSTTLGITTCVQQLTQRHPMLGSSQGRRVPEHAHPEPEEMLTWVRLPRLMALVPLGYIQVKAHRN